MKGKKRMPDSEAKRRWDAENTEKITIKFQKKTDTDILDFLRESVDGTDISKQTVIKAALREYMERHKEG